MPWWGADQDNAGLGRAKYVHRADKSKKHNEARGLTMPAKRVRAPSPRPEPAATAPMVVKRNDNFGRKIFLFKDRRGW